MKPVYLTKPDEIGTLVVVTFLSTDHIHVNRHCALLIVNTIDPPFSLSKDNISFVNYYFLSLLAHQSLSPPYVSEWHDLICSK